MKKNIAIIISIMTLVFVISTFRIYYEKSIKTLAGEKLYNYLYKYKLNLDNTNELNSTTILEDKIYFLTNTSSTYTLYSKDLYSRDNIKIKDFNADTCDINNIYITCNTNDIMSIYNILTNKSLEIDYNENSYIIPYKDTNLKLESNKLILLENNMDFTFRTIKEHYTFETFYKTEDTTYILLNNYQNKTYYLYDIKKDNYEKILSDTFTTYQNGLVFMNSDTINIYDLKNNKTKKYTNNMDITLDYVNTLSIDSKNLYLINEDNLEIINLELNTKKLISLNKLNITSVITNIFEIDSTIYLETIYDNSVYRLDIKEFPVKNIKNILANFSSKENIIATSNLEDYKINIKTKEEAIIEFPDFSAELIMDDTKIKDNISRLEKIANKFNKDFFENFYLNDYEGLNVYLTGTLTPSNYDTQASNPAAYSLEYNKEYMMVIDINEPNIEELFCHELMHNIEFNLKNKNLEAFPKWEEYNPDNFFYTYSYTKNSNFNYSLNEIDSSKVYFVDIYSHTYPLEDRARIFEKICSVDNSILNNYPNLKAKGEYLKEEILTNYPTLKETILFNSLN